MQNQVAYVVLHYKTVDETERCVSKLLKLTNRKIVVVCNGSNNGSDMKIAQMYTHNPEITVLVNPENLGFANGLNVGIRYAVDVLNVACNVCINNDVYIDQLDFSEELLRQLEINQFALAAPDVVNLEGIHCNPMSMRVPTEEHIQKTLRHYRYRYQCSKLLYGIPEMVYRAFERVSNKMKKGKEIQEILPLFHGCCWCFSREYFKVFDGICSKTYLYGEEPILSYLCFLHGLKMVYLPSLAVVHGESIATKRELKNFGKRKVFYYQHLIRSTEVLLELVQCGKEHPLEK